MSTAVTIEPVLRSELLRLARTSIGERLRHGITPPLPHRAWPVPLGAPGASFVTLTVDDRLRGCCGSIIAHAALVEDVWCNAQRSAAEDPRFAPMSEAELSACSVSISVLGALEPVPVHSEQALLDVLRPGVDGLLMTLGSRRATFLPKVWETLPEPRGFVGQLKCKMGLPAQFWDPRLEFQRYRTTEFAEQANAA